MAAKRDYYDVLGISRSADKGTIKRAYRKLAKKYHPDTNAGNAQAEEKFKEATEAYNVLSNPEKKKLYDQFGHAAFDGSAGGSGAYGYGNGPGGGTYSYTGPNGSFHEYHFEGGDMDDILKNIFGGGFSEGSGSGFHGFGGFGNSGSGRTRTSGRSYESSGFGNGFGNHGFGGEGNFRQDGSDVTAEIDVTFDEAAFGGDKVIWLSDAQGSNAAGKSLKVHIPAGISDGKSIRLRGKGMPGLSGGKAGDLLLKVRVGKRPGFERKDMDVYSTVMIPFTTAVLGGEAVVQTLTGRVVCKINPGTQSGTKIRLKGKGIVSMKDAGRYGDQYVTVQIDVPKNLSNEAKRKLKEFEAACKNGSRGAA